MYFKKLIDNIFEELIEIYKAHSLAKTHVTTADSALAETKRHTADALLQELKRVDFNPSPLDYKKDLVPLIYANHAAAEAATQTLNHSGNVVIPRINGSYSLLSRTLKEFIDFIFLEFERDLYKILATTRTNALTVDIRLDFKALILGYSAKSFIYRKLNGTALSTDTFYSPEVNQQKILKMESLLAHIDKVHTKLEASIFRENMGFLVEAAQFKEYKIQTRQTSTSASTLFFDARRVLYNSSSLATLLQEFHDKHWMSTEPTLEASASAARSAT